MSHYEINVAALDGVTFDKKPRYIHFFATHKRSCTTHGEVREVYNALVKAFPAPKFKIDITYYVGGGQEVDPVTL